MSVAPTSGNLLAAVAPSADAEQFTELLSRPGVHVSRIVSTGQASPEGFWYDQDDGEWVVLLTGEARLSIEGESEPRTLMPGDWIDLPPHCRHRVEWTAPDRETVWLAIHYR